MAIHGMIDLETLGADLNSVILTVGAVKFNPESDVIVDKLYIKLDVDEQIAMGRTINDGTVEWWAKQGPEVRDDAFSEHDRVSFRDGLEALQKFLWGSERVWANGMDFDLSMIAESMRRNDIVVPWDYWKARDTRTLFEIAGVSLRDNKHITTHNALDDALHQVRTVQSAFSALRKFNVVPRVT